MAIGVPCILLGMLLMLGGSSAAKRPTLRGVAPSSIARYQGATFTCLDNSKTIPIDRVNDDYCDCPDGSDEPGTSACPNGVFHCRNRGHQPRTLRSMFVDDGICDCCDGSDEKRGVCANTCSDIGRHAREETLRAAQTELQGAAIRSKRAAEYQQLRASWTRDLQAVQSDIAAQQKIVEEARKARDELQALEDERRRAAGEPPVPAVEEPAPHDESDHHEHEDIHAGSDFDHYNTDDAEPIPGDESDPVPHEEQRRDDRHNVPHEPFEPSDTDPGHDDFSGDLPGAGGEEEEDPEEIGRRIASRWTHDPAAAGSHAEEDKVEGEAGEGEEGAQAEGGAAAGGGEAAGGKKRSLLGRFKGLWSRKGSDDALAPAAAPTPGAPSPIPDALQKARDAAQAAEAQLRALEDKKASLDGKLSQNYGPDGAFAPLADKCFEKQVDKYIYKACMYGRADQREGEHGSGTSLGNFKELAATHILFADGQHCWQGPNRSIKLNLVCGLVDQLGKVEEPSRCEYTADFVTPSACDAAKAAQLKAEWAALEKEAKEASAAGVHDEF